MTEEKKTLKFQMMMAPSEAEELDDWMFKNRLRSRAEAIRRLCQIGLTTSSRAKTLKNIAQDLHFLTNGLDVEIEKAIEKTSSIDTQKDLNRLFEYLSTAIEEINIIVSTVETSESKDNTISVVSNLIDKRTKIIESEIDKNQTSFIED